MCAEHLTGIVFFVTAVIVSVFRRPILCCVVLEGLYLFEILRLDSEIVVKKGIHVGFLIFVPVISDLTLQKV